VLGIRPEAKDDFINITQINDAAFGQTNEGWLVENLRKNHGYEPQSKLWKTIPQQATVPYTLRFAGLFNLPISIRFAQHPPGFAFGIGVSQIKYSFLCYRWSRK